MCLVTQAVKYITQKSEGEKNVQTREKIYDGFTTLDLGTSGLEKRTQSQERVLLFQYSSIPVFGGIEFIQQGCPNKDE